MLEYLCLENIIKDKVVITNEEEYLYGKDDYLEGFVKGSIKAVDINKLFDRRTTLLEELLEPYVIDSTSKEE